MKIGDEVYVHGYIDEIRQDTVIIRNDGGYFGTVPSEVIEKKPKHGEWIVYPLVDAGRVELECPICGDTSIRAVDCKPHFCENCGAKMR